MSDDSFIREVDEEMRSDRVKAVWSRYGNILIGVAVLAVLATAAWRGYDYWQAVNASASGDRFLAALNLASEGKQDEALAALGELEKDGHGAYPVLARMRTGTILAEKGDAAGAVAAFDAVAADSATPAPIAGMARLRAAYLLVDTAAYEDVATRVETLAVAGNPLRHSAREVLALAAWKAGRTDDARRLYEEIGGDAESPGNLRQRATIMLGLIASGGTPG